MKLGGVLDYGVDCARRSWGVVGGRSWSEDIGVFFSTPLLVGLESFLPESH